MGTPKEAIPPKNVHQCSKLDVPNPCTHYIHPIKKNETSFQNSGGLFFLHTQKMLSLSVSLSRVDSCPESSGSNGAGTEQARFLKAYDMFSVQNASVKGLAVNLAISLVEMDTPGLECIKARHSLL
ncbi:hypothetical protein DPMN_068090 [Dreissena polymorpha]|uniref:Uncharacterized protein n=1 Tax=Dreissena polymorpha TaxID=45954 RepID=A0A9D4BTY3_DREPO|nr:hypothetical protein DPMN_068090 [Dreissena polymorpha]